MPGLKARPTSDLAPPTSQLAPRASHLTPPASRRQRSCSRRVPTRKGGPEMSDLQTTLALPLVLIADCDGGSSARRADQMRGRGFRVAVARTPFETIVKASCQLPDLILV